MLTLLVARVISAEVRLVLLRSCTAATSASSRREGQVLAVACTFPTTQLVCTSRPMGSSTWLPPQLAPAGRLQQESWSIICHGEDTSRYGTSHCRSCCMQTSCLQLPRGNPCWALEALTGCNRCKLAYACRNEQSTKP